ncbi:hypothetical protein PT974_03695 [Cladobotryum mycophilum]|uniref:Uncharacterized protein n=1 Tax=Cladobotryum mycophilum TaxID=491253 RepID=A0ABR0ST53_9HYPO
MVINASDTNSPEPPLSSSPTHSHGNRFFLTITNLALSLYQISYSTLRELFNVAYFATAQHWLLAVTIASSCASILWTALRGWVIITLHILKIVWLAFVLLLVVIVRKLINILPCPIIEHGYRLIAFMRGRGKTPRPVISAPIGPVKNSRGADLIRSDKLIIVETLKECENDVSTLEHDLSVSIQTSRRVSASFSSSGPLSSSPTVASSDITATPTIQHPSGQYPSKKARKSFLTTSSIPKPFKSSSSKLMLSKPNPIQDENVPPSLDDLDVPAPQQSRITSKLPKSRTMNALQELKSSMSRPSLGSRYTNTANLGGYSRKASSSSTTTPLLSSTSSRLRLPRSSLASLARSSRSCTPEPLPAQISSAQSSAYWSGRFVALNDRFSSENLTLNAASSSMSNDTQSLRQLQSTNETPYSNLYQRTAHLPHSSTTSALKTMPSAPVVPAVTEDDIRCRRIFAHLNSLCTTPEAKRSLCSWQQAYARRHGRACLLPEGGSMEDKGLMAKIFGSGPVHRGERRSLHALRQATANRANRSMFSENTATPSRSKRLTVS